MSLPREGSRTIGEGIIVAEAMDWCRSPTAIVPYRIYTHHQVEGASTADSVRQTDERSHVRGSLIRQCYGDEPGVGGGVRSGTRGAECEPKTWSSSVRAEGRPMVRHDDEWWMNHRNTYGRLTYVKDTKRYDTPEEREITPRMPGASGPPGETASDASPDAVRPGAQYAQLAVPMPGPVPVPMPVPPIPPGQGTAAADAVWKGIKGLKPEEGETFSDYMQRPLYNLGIKKKKEKSGTKSGTGSVRISARDRQRKCPCTVEPYSKQKTACQVECPGSQAHHIVPDYLLGASNRKMRERGDRLYANDGSRLTSFGDGPAICLIGNKSTQGTPHNAAHGETAKSSQRLPTTVGCFPSARALTSRGRTPSRRDRNAAAKS